MGASSSRSGDKRKASVDAAAGKPAKQAKRAAAAPGAGLGDFATDGGECVIKVVVLGDHACGKTAIIDRYCKGSHAARHTPTIGPQATTCEVDPSRIPEARTVNERLYTRFVELPMPETSPPGTLAKHVRDADGVVIVGDTTRIQSFAVVDRLLTACRGQTRADTVYAVLLHKSDKKSNKLTWRDSDAGQAYAVKAGVAVAAATSAAQSKSVEPQIEALLGRIIRAAAGAGGHLAERLGRPAAAPREVTVRAATVDDLGGVVDEDRIKQLESHVVSFLNMHTQAFGDYKRPLLTAMSSAAGRLPHNHTRVEAGSFLEIDLLKECDTLFERLKQLRLAAPLRDYAHVDEFHRLAAHFYRHLIPHWGLLTNELSVEATLAQARGAGKLKAGVVVSPAQHGTAVIAPPTMFAAYLKGIPDRVDPSGKLPKDVPAGGAVVKDNPAGGNGVDAAPGVSTAATPLPAGGGGGGGGVLPVAPGSMSSDATSNLIGTSAPSASSVHVVSPINDSWECAIAQMAGAASHSGANAKPCSLSNLSEVKTPRFYESSPPIAHPNLPVTERRVHPMVQADRDFLKALSQSRTDLKQLKELLSRTSHRVAKESAARLRQRSPVTHPQGAGGGKTVYTNSRISRSRGNSVGGLDGKSIDQSTTRTSSLPQGGDPTLRTPRFM